MRIAVGSDHAGFALKNRLRDLLKGEGHDVVDFGTHSPESADYPEYARLVGNAISSGECDLGVLVCGSGLGMCIAANKVRGVRAVTVMEPVAARLSREHNNANVICLGERLIGPDLAVEAVRAFVATPFSGLERHARRVALIDEIDG
jgi:ribose 5-phosphate isomerase B